MKLYHILIALSLSGCAFIDNPENIGNMFCGWLDTGIETVPTQYGEGCWIVYPEDNDISIMPIGASACDADSGTDPMYLKSGESYQTFVRFGSSGHTRTRRKKIDCPVE